MELNLLLSGAIIVACTAVAVSVMLLVRRRAPRGGFFADSDRAASVLGFIGTTFSVILAFVIFLALETYTNAKTEAAHEADALLEQFEIAALFSERDRDVVRSQLICYGRSVLADEWDLMREGKRSSATEAWVLQIEHTIDAINVEGPKQVTGFDKFFEETIERENGRRGRLQEAQGVVPDPMWLILLLGAGCLVGFVFFYADSGERRLVQAVLIGSVTALVVTSLLLVDFLDHPYRDGAGSIQPTSMQLAVQTMEDESQRDVPPCDALGNAF